MRVLVWLVLMWPGVLAAQCAVPGNAAAMAGAVYAGVNAERAAAGRAALAPEARLAVAAQAQACDMATTGLRDHRGSDGSAVDERVRRAGFRTCLTAENIGWGYADAGRMLAGWMASPGHRGNILNDRVSAMGVGLAQGADGPQWVLVLARPC